MTSTDLVVVLPGIMGSTLEVDRKPVWAPTAGALLRGIATLGRSLTALRLPQGIRDEHPGDGIEPGTLVPDVHAIPGIWTPIRGYDRLLQRLHKLHRDGSIGKVLPVAYDWRLSNRYNAGQLAGIVEDELDRWQRSDPSRADAQLVFVCHSMGGLVARWYIEKCGGAAHTRKLITLGTPYRGAAKAVTQVAGEVRYGLGPIGLDLTRFAHSLPSLHQLLPDYACIEQGTALRRLDELSVPDMNTDMLTDAMEFHRVLNAAERARPVALEATHPIVGAKQPTPTSVRLTAEGIELSDTIDGANEYGDGTVPTAGSVPDPLDPDSNRLRHIFDLHGNLQANTAALDEVESILVAPVRRRDMGGVTVRVSAPDLVLLGEPVTVTVDVEPGPAGNVPAVEVRIVREHEPGTLAPQPDIRRPAVRDLRAATTITPDEPGAHTIAVTGVRPGAVSPVVATTLVWPHTG